MKKTFTFTLPVNIKAVEDLKVVNKTVGYIVVVGVAYENKNASIFDINERYSYDINGVLWKGVDVWPLLQATGGTQFVEDETFKKIPSLFINQ